MVAKAKTASVPCRRSRLVIDDMVDSAEVVAS